MFLTIRRIKRFSVVLLATLVPLVFIIKLNRNSRLVIDARRFNLLSESSKQLECSLDEMNEQRLQQDHPCVLRNIRRYFLSPPTPAHVPYNLTYTYKDDPSAGQPKVVLQLLSNKTRGFFIECGAVDGEWLSNTLYMEHDFKWEGILIEANPSSFQLLRNKQRKSWALSVCLSLEPHPSIVPFKSDWAVGKVQETLPSSADVDKDISKVQCFPLYSILLAVNRTTIDFFSLDVEGHELKVLQTIPWHLVDIKVLSVEWEHVPGGKVALTSFMERNGYHVATEIDSPFAKDLIFLKNE